MDKSDTEDDAEGEGLSVSQSSSRPAKYVEKSKSRKGYQPERPREKWKPQTGVTYDPSVRGLWKTPTTAGSKQKDLSPPKEKLNLADQEKSPHSDGISSSGKLNHVEPAAEEAGPSLSSTASTRRSGRSKKPVDYRDSTEV